MAKDEEVEWRRMRRLNGEGSKRRLVGEILSLLLLSPSFHGK